MNPAFGAGVGVGTEEMLPLASHLRQPALRRHDLNLCGGDKRRPTTKRIRPGLGAIV